MDNTVKWTFNKEIKEIWQKATGDAIKALEDYLQGNMEDLEFSKEIFMVVINCDPKINRHPFIAFADENGLGSEIYGQSGSKFLYFKFQDIIPADHRYYSTMNRESWMLVVNVFGNVLKSYGINIQNTLD